MGNVQFNDSKVLFTDNDKVAMHEDCCCPDPCAECAEGTTPRQWKVVIADVADGVCSGCELFNATFYLPQILPCAWRYLFVTWDHGCPGGGSQTFMVLLQLLAGHINVQLWVGTHWSATFVHNWPGDADCEAEDLDVPYSSQSASGFCDASGATVTVTAIP